MLVKNKLYQGVSKERYFVLVSLMENIIHVHVLLLNLVKTIVNIYLILSSCKPCVTYKCHLCVHFILYSRYLRKTKCKLMSYLMLLSYSKIRKLPVLFLEHHSFLEIKVDCSFYRFKRMYLPFAVMHVNISRALLEEIGRSTPFIPLKLHISPFSSTFRNVQSCTFSLPNKYQSTGKTQTFSLSVIERITHYLYQNKMNFLYYRLSTLLLSTRSPILPILWPEANYCSVIRVKETLLFVLICKWESITMLKLHVLVLVELMMYTCTFTLNMNVYNDSMYILLCIIFYCKNDHALRYFKC